MDDKEKKNENIIKLKKEILQKLSNITKGNQDSY